MVTAQTTLISLKQTPEFAATKPTHKLIFKPSERLVEARPTEVDVWINGEKVINKDEVFPRDYDILLFVNLLLECFKFGAKSKVRFEVSSSVQNFESTLVFVFEGTVKEENNGRFLLEGTFESGVLDRPITTSIGKFVLHS